MFLITFVKQFYEHPGKTKTNQTKAIKFWTSSTNKAAYFPYISNALSFIKIKRMQIELSTIFKNGGCM